MALSYQGRMGEELFRKEPSIKVQMKFKQNYGKVSFISESILQQICVLLWWGWV
jgi:hypothetical protein